MTGTGARRILVTGGAGFVGSHLVERLLRADEPPERITVLDALTYAGRRDHLAAVCNDPRLSVLIGDIADPEAATAAVRGQDAVINVAAESHVDRSISGDTAFSRTNVVGTHVLLEAARRAGVGTFLQISTDEVYGSVRIGSCQEDAALAPSSVYSASKASADLLALAYHRTHGMDVRITRGSNTFGPRQHTEKLIPRFVTALLTGERVPLYGDGSHVREWLHVDDHCRGIEAVLAAGRPGRIYHVGGGMALSNLELTNRLLRLCERGEDAVDHVADRPGHDRRYALDWSRIRDELSYRPVRDFDAELAATVDWYRVLSLS